MSTPFRSAVMTLCAGLAVSAHAQSVPVDDARLEATRKLIDRQRQLVREGKMDPRLAISPLVLDDRFPPARSILIDHTDSDLHNINHPWAYIIDRNDFIVDFDTTLPWAPYTVTSLDPTPENPFHPLGGVITQFGEVWYSSPNAISLVGVVDNHTAQSGSRWDPDGADGNPSTDGVQQGDPSQHGVAGGPDPTGSHGKFVVAAAGSMEDQSFETISRIEGWLTAKYFYPRPESPVLTIVDMYHDREDSMLWYAPLSESEGDLYTLSSFWFGYTFDELGPLADPDGVIRRPILSSNDQRYDRSLDFVAPPSTSPWRIKTDEWFTVAIRQSVSSYSVWVRDSQTIGTNGFEQNSIYDGVQGTKDPNGIAGAFAGEIFERDWLQLMPGVEDDPLTLLVEGYGAALNILGEPAVSFVDSSGSPAGTPSLARGVDAIHFRGGFDPSPTDVPNFTPNDHYIDNFVISGTPAYFCRTDLTGDSTVNNEDLNYFMVLLDEMDGYDYRLDFNSDRIAGDGKDLGILLAAWGGCYSPLDPIPIPPCAGDVSGDDVVDLLDLNSLIAAIEYDQYSERKDMNRDGHVDSEDIGLLLSQWGPCPE